MKLFIGSLMAVVVFCEGAFAQREGLQKQTLEPCAWWAYNYDVNGYLCVRTLPKMTVYSAVEVDRTIDRLDKVIVALEMRLAALESARP